MTPLEAIHSCLKSTVSCIHETSGKGEGDRKLFTAFHDEVLIPAFRTIGERLAEFKEVKFDTQGGFSLSEIPREVDRRWIQTKLTHEKVSGDLEVSTIVLEDFFTGALALVTATLNAIAGIELGEGMHDILETATTHAQEILTIQMGSHRISNRAFSPDGRNVAVTRDSTVEVWNLETHREVLREEMEDTVFDVAFSPDGRYLAAGAVGQALRAWDLQAQQEVFRVNIRDRVANPAADPVVFSPGQRHIAAGSCVWDFHTSHEVIIKDLDIFSKDYTALVDYSAFSPDGRQFVAGSHLDAMQVWNLETHREVLKGEKPDSVNCVAFSPDGPYLAAGSTRGAVHILDLQTHREVFRQEWESRIFTTDSVAFSPDGRYLAAGADALRAWDLQTRREVLRAEGRYCVNSLAFSPDGRYLAAGFPDRTLLVWDLQARSEVFRESIGNPVVQVAFSTDGTLLAAGSGDQAIHVWRWQPGNP